MRRVRSQFHAGAGLGWLAAALIGAAGLAPVASAATVEGSGIKHVWGNVQAASGIAGGLFNTSGPRGVAVNDDTGDVFVADTGNHRIQQFDADGDFVRAWGQDVIANIGVPANSNGTGFEICDVTTLPANTADDCKQGITTAVAGANPGGQFSSPAGLAVNQQNGHLYVSDAGFNRVQEFSFNSSGRPVFVRAFGQDVVTASGSENVTAKPAIQSLTVDATGGQLRLTFQGQTTGDIAFDAPATGAGSVQEALQSLSSIGTGNVTVAGAAGGPYTITFAGALTNSPQPPIQASDGTVPLTGGTGAQVATTQVGATGFEICTVVGSCKAGVTTGASGGVFQTMGYPAVAPAGAPNAGNVLVANSAKLRVDEFTASGQFVRAFGWNVVAAGPGNDTVAPVDQFEVCSAASFDVCKIGVTGSGAGQFGNTVNRVAEDSDGNIYTVESTVNFRVQRFSLPGDVVTPEGAFAPDVLTGTSAAAPAANNPTEVAVDDDGYVYAVRAFPPGTGTPAAVIPPEQSPTGLPAIQQRVLKIDPQTGDVARTFLSNPGAVMLPGDSLERAIHNPAPSLTGLAIRGAGLPLYVSNSNPTGGQSRARVYLVDELDTAAPTLAVSDLRAASATLEATVEPVALRALGTRYRFEYSRLGADDWSEFRVPTVDADLGNSSAGGESDSCSPQAPAAVCHVAQPIEGLFVNQAYEFRVVVRTGYNGVVYTSDPVGFETTIATPGAITDAASWTRPPEADPQLVFTGRVNPQGLQTTYEVQYVSDEDFGEAGFAGAAKAPVVAGDAGHGVVDRAVTVVAGEDDVDPARTYRYRLVAINAEGTTTGATRVVEPPEPTDRFVELVSRGDNQGAGLNVSSLTVSDDGERAMFIAIAFGEQQGSPFITNPNVATRGESGWTAAPVNHPAAGSVSGVGDAQVTRRLWLAEVSATESQWLLRARDGGLAPASPLLSPLDRVSGDALFEFAGGTPDVSTFAFSNTNDGASGKTLLPGEPMVLGQDRRYSNLYALTGAGTADPDLHVVNRDADGNVVGGACGARLGAERTPDDDGTSVATTRTRAVSANGSAIYFSARPTAAPGATCNAAAPVRLFKRVDNTSTVAVSTSQCDRAPSDPGGACSSVDGSDYFWGASADGSKVYFTTNRQLTDSDTDSTGEFGFSNCTGLSAAFHGGCDLYLYDSSPPDGQPSLVQVSAGEVTDDHPTPGAGAGVLGVADVSMDGSRVYFVATGRLTDEATAGANNLYVYRRDAGEPGGTIGFVATLSPRPGTVGDPADRDLWDRFSSQGKPAFALPYYDGLGDGRSDGDGHLLLFLSEGQLIPGEDHDSFDDLYRYDDTTGELSCLTCIGDGPFHVRLSQRSISHSDPDAIQQQRIASEDGSAVVFQTEEGLVEGDGNDTHDAYVWREGEGLELVSGATGTIGTVGGFEGGVARPVISPNGDSVFFMTRATLVPQDTNNDGRDWYVARVGGGFAQQPQRPGCLAAEGGCQGDGATSEDATRSTSDTSPSDRNSGPTARKTLAVGRLTAKTLRRAARTGVLGLRVRSSAPGRVAVVAHTRVGGRRVLAGRGAKRLSGGGTTTIRIRLGRAVRMQLRRAGRSALAIEVRSPGARPRAVSVVLRRAAK